MAAFAPLNDCRITVRCLHSLKAKVVLEDEFAVLRNESTLIDTFFEQRENDERGGEGGARVQQIRSRPAFKLTSGRMRGATWFDRDHPPQPVVWLLGAELHDERHKGRADAYDILGQLDASDQLFPAQIDFKRLESDRRRRDVANVADDVRRDAATAVADLNSGEQQTTVAGVPVRLIVSDNDGMTELFVAVSEAPVTGKHSGLPIELTSPRFLGIMAGISEAVEQAHQPPALAEELLDRSLFPGPLGRERPFLVYFQR
jgi:hypothetical protein